MKKDRINKRRKKMLRSRKNELKRALTLFYAINAVITGAFLLYLGITVSGRYTERNISGETKELYYLDDIKNAVSDLLKRELTELPLV